jgi:hypothetical protein
MRKVKASRLKRLHQTSFFARGMHWTVLAACCKLGMIKMLFQGILPSEVLPDF